MSDVTQVTVVENETARVRLLDMGDHIALMRETRPDKDKPFGRAEQIGAARVSMEYAVEFFRY